MLTRDQILARLEGVRRTGGGWTAQCPSHDDHKASLTIAAGRDGKVLLHCHAGCSFQEVIAALSEEVGVASDVKSENAIKQTAVTRTIVATYDYTDKQGHLMFQVVRYDPKDFRQRQPDGQGGWIWNLHGVRRELYRLPELVGAAPEAWGLVAEGEKSVERLREEGFVATTNPGGAGKWRGEYTQYFEGRKVAILPDNDDTGRRHAWEVAKALHSVALQLKVIELPGLPERGDACDWFHAEGSREELENLVEQAPLWKDTVSDAPDEETEGKEKERKDYSSAAERLVELVEKKGVTLFHDQHGAPHVAIHGDGREVVKTQSRRFKRWLAHLAWTELGKVVPSEALRSAMQVIEGKALFEGAMYELSVRVTWHEEAILYDLGDGRAVRIDPRGWHIEEKPPIIFRRLPHQEPEVEPVRGGRLEELLDFTNVPITGAKDRVAEDRLLAIVYPVISLVVGIVHVVLAIHGVQGSAKSTLMRLYKKLIDPSRVGLISAPDNLREFVQVCSHHWVLYLDNLTTLPGWLSDALCRASTGEAFSKRELYTDDDDIIYSYKRVVGVNGINLAASKPDLLDRCLILELERVEHFESERQFWDRFEEARARILGAMFTALSEAMRIVDTMTVPSQLRLVDYVRWGCAVSEALGYGSQAYVEAFGASLEQQVQEAIDASPVAQGVLHLVEKRHRWQGTPTELLTELEETAGTLKIDTRSKAWPKSANWVWRRINEVRPNLVARGVSAERGKDRQRLITISRVAENAVYGVRGVQAEQDDCTGSPSLPAPVDSIDSKDSISPSFGGDPERTSEVDIDEIPF